MTRLSWTSRSEAETLCLGRALGQALRGPAWIGVTGPLGAGKTRLIQGAAQGLGYKGRVRSPSYVLEHRYPGGRLPIRHLDLYRLDSVDAELEAGWEEDDRSVVLVEWADRVEEPPPGAILVSIQPLSEESRRIEVSWDPAACALDASGLEHWQPTGGDGRSGEAEEERTG